MSRLILLVLLGLVTWGYFPETRTLLLAAVEPLTAPIQRDLAYEEMSEVARHVVDHERLTDAVPGGPQWMPWLEYRYGDTDRGRDPWGSPYQLLVWPDSIGIVSSGPDRERGTPDDLTRVEPRA